MADPLSVLAGVLGVLEKALSVLRGAGGRRQAEVDARRQTATATIKDLSELFKKFEESIDVILEAISPERRHLFSTVDRYKANRRLVELSTDMRLLTHAIQKRFPGGVVAKIREITDGCMQIMQIEELAVELLPPGAFDQLPVNEANDGVCPIWTNARVPETIACLTGPTGAHVAAVRLFNDLLIRINECRERISIALGEVSGE